MRIIRTVAALLSVTLALLSNGCASGTATSSSAPNAASASSAAKRAVAKKLVVVGINDTHGGLMAQPAAKWLAKLFERCSRKSSWI